MGGQGTPYDPCDWRGVQKCVIWITQRVDCLQLGTGLALPRNPHWLPDHCHGGRFPDLGLYQLFPSLVHPPPGAALALPILPQVLHWPAPWLHHLADKVCDHLPQLSIVTTGPELEPRSLQCFSLESLASQPASPPAPQGISVRNKPAATGQWVYTKVVPSCDGYTSVCTHSPATSVLSPTHTRARALRESRALG